MALKNSQRFELEGGKTLVACQRADGTDPIIIEFAPLRSTWLHPELLAVQPP